MASSRCLSREGQEDVGVEGAGEILESDPDFLPRNHPGVLPSSSGEDRGDPPAFSSLWAWRWGVRGGGWV